VKFTELGNIFASDTIYSAGMQAMLALPSHLQSPITIARRGHGHDYFQEAQERVQRFMGAARIVVLASHPLNCVEEFAPAVLMSKGLGFSDIDEAFARYARSSMAGVQSGLFSEATQSIPLRLFGTRFTIVPAASTNLSALRLILALLRR
jgi:ABC-type polysaccharide/polyol phosphate transport system ATPase subunit